MAKRPAVSTAALKYEPRYCVEVVEFMARGYSLTAFAGEIGTSRANLMKWCADHSPFAKAVEHAQARRARLLEDKMLAAKGASAFGAHMQALKTAAPEEWYEQEKRSASKTPGRLTPATFKLPDNGRDQEC